MRATQYPFFTLKETPNDAEIISHKLMLKSGMIRKISSGLYIWLPTGIRVLKKIKKIINNEMKKINALEISCPIIQPEFLWETSGRLSIYGKELLKFSDRRNNKFILSPTNEEIVTKFINSEIHSYKNLPLILYQIKTKFRDEIRPRFGIIRTREFIMKDAYSFHVSQECLKKTYSLLYNSYINIFKQIQLKFHVVEADSGLMGGNTSHEFQALSKNGEDEVVFSDDLSYSSNINTAQSIETVNFLKNIRHYQNIEPPNKCKNKKIMSSLSVSNQKNYIKTILVKSRINNTVSAIALLIRGDHEFNIFKIEKIDMIEKPVSFLSEKEIILLTGYKKKFLGPIGLKIPIIADISTYNMKNFTIGSNLDNNFFINVNWNIDLPLPIFKDIRKVTKNDISPNGKGLLNIKKSIEIGHIFQLDKKYSKSMKTFFKNKNGIQKHIHMGCYGIGITRIVAALIEQNNDINGIIWPSCIAPFQVAILPINMHKKNKIKEAANNLYKKLQHNAVDTILYDRNERPGIMFNEIDLIGIPHQIIISENGICNDRIEYRTRKNKKSIFMPMQEIINFLMQKISP